MEIKDYQKGDENKILALFLEAFKKPMAMDYWRWRFADNPTKKIMIKLMWDNDVLAGHYAVSPLYMNVGGENVLSSLSMATMTHPNYAGRGIFSDLAENLYNEEANNKGLSSVWGYPNNNSHYAFIKNLKWVNLEQVPNFSLKIERLKKSSTELVKQTPSFQPNHVAAYKKSTSNFGVKVEKDVDYLNWRYIKNPSNKYQIFDYNEGDLSYYAVIKLYPLSNSAYEMDLVELCFPPNYELLLQLFNDILKYNGTISITKINSWIPLNHPLHIHMEKIGFVHDLPVTYSGVRVMNEKFNQMKNPVEWFYCMGDSDVY
jgi:hypothetical protein